MTCENKQLSTFIKAQKINLCNMQLDLHYENHVEGKKGSLICQQFILIQKSSF